MSDGCLKRAVDVRASVEMASGLLYTAQGLVMLLRWDELVCPTLLVDEMRARWNIREMADRARRSGVRFRPHFKTHQSADVGHWFREAGVTSITVSSVAMAEYFAASGWRDILIASPINVLEAVALNQLAQQLSLSLTIDSVDAIERLAETLCHPISIWIEVDTGDNRTGVHPSDRSQIEAIVRKVVETDRWTLAGLIAHDGQTYASESVRHVSDIHEETMARLRTLAAVVEAMTGARPELSIGDTPTCKLVDDLGGADEVRPGNFVFGDLTQLAIGSIREEDLALALACPVVSKNAHRRELVLQGGAVHLSMAALPDEEGKPTYGRIVRLTDDGWGSILPGCTVSRLSQELAIVQASEALFASVQIGDLLGVLPVHSCLTVDVMKSMRSLEGSTIKCFQPSGCSGRTDVASLV